MNTLTMQQQAEYYLKQLPPDKLALITELLANLVQTEPQTELTQHITDSEPSQFFGIRQNDDFDVSQYMRTLRKGRQFDVD
ncbi:hypothetical protein [Candidatus Albibeggiatoa sp. nov. BB20]|uniref:hypothetical protein n=1 Tax=Candidatus Albibeggiatoa sp. nov. BB20 TaxID=3162723 RepID=UPI00336554D2